MIDLDDAARLIALRRDDWMSSGLEVGDVTWRDQGEGRPPRLKTVRAEVVTPDSIGIEVRKGTQEGRLVLFDGGWADLEWWSGEETGEPLLEAPGYGDWLDLGRFEDLLDRFASLFS